MATEWCFSLCLSSVSRRFRLHLFSRTWCAPLRSQLLAYYIIRLHGIWTRFWSTCQAPPFWALADASFRNKTRNALFLVAMATAKRVGELQALSFSVSHRGDDLVLHYDPFFLTKTESVSKPLPKSVIAQSLADLLETYPNGFFAQFALFVISDELLALLSLLHLGYSSPHRILNELCRRMLCRSSLNN